MQRQDPREPSPWQPLAVAVVSLTVFGVLMAAGAVAHWGHPAAYEQAIGQVSRWCERVSGGWLREPSNTLGNIGFIIAGLTMFVMLARDTSRDRRVTNPFIGNQGIALLYAGAATFLGPGSMLMHASHTFAGAWLDNVSMVAYILVPVLYNLALLGRWSVRVFAITYVTVLVLYALGYWFLGPDLRVNFELFRVCIPLWLISEFLIRFWTPRNRWLSGLIGFVVAMAFGIFPWTIVMHPAQYWWVPLFWLPALLAAGRVPVRRTYLPWYVSGVAAFLAAFWIWTQGKGGTALCQPDSWLQFHAVWHVLCAVATFCFFMFLRTQRFDPQLAQSEQPTPDEQPVPDDQPAPTEPESAA